MVIPLGYLWSPLAMMVTISLFSGTAGVQLHGWSFIGIDKLGHFVIFGLLGVAWARGFRSAGFKMWQVFVFSVGLTTLFGFLDELHQYTNPLRSFEWADLMADFVGAATGTALYNGVRWVRLLLELEFKDLARLRSSNKITNSP
jgi:uncharacterized protein YfiM (DUF2279 family)